ncbi:MAG: hypothetical protein A2W68_07380 [Betaproteobacteria bacterium RIFCSPLOWO2_02_64_14]|nr:MAG: hypothetical protein A2W68_07380 [Betaproteobacteria bacterium RIFCSPLOWO2_02_64_14]
MAASSLDTVFNHPAIWRGSDCARVALPSVPTGYAELDTLLPGSGWPAGALTEICGERSGIGELQLVMPAAARLSHAGHWVIMITPPHIPYAPALAAHGIQLSRLMLVRPEADEEKFWACEQALRSACCGAVLMWTDHSRERSIRRLQLAAERGGALAILFRSSRAIPLVTAALRLHIGKSDNSTIVRILKRRGGGIPAPVALDLHGKLAEDDFPMRCPALACVFSSAATH